ncbi:hypothetical protein ACFVJ5_27220 [Nocardia sp. NPDC127606]|uniref:hypothetical protein n=1 Tax=Nocardia sp. NPDC127606 TaxID=3345406 RepID=UPI0036328E20
MGTFATPSKPKKQRNGSWKATVRFYGVWGTPQITRFGKTSGEASDRLAEAMRDFREVPRNSQITRSTTLTMLAQELLAEMRADTACSAGLVEDYRREIEVSTHRLANPKTIKIDNSIGRLQIWQATAGELDRHIKQLTTLGLRRKAKQHKIILRAMMQIAVRHGALDANPIDGVAAFRRVAKPARGKMADMESLPAFRDQVRAWARGEEVPGTPAYISGPKRDWTMVWVVDVITGTGIRPYEVFALLLDEINLDAPVPYFDVTGTLVEVKGADNGGWVRKPTPKTENGWRRILLPQHTVEAIGEAIIDLEITRCPNPMGLLFPARNGSLRNPNGSRHEVAILRSNHTICDVHHKLPGGREKIERTNCTAPQGTPTSTHPQPTTGLDPGPRHHNPVDPGRSRTHPGPSSRRGQLQRRSSGAFRTRRVQAAP